MRNLITNSSEVVAGDVPAGVDEELLVAMAGAADARRQARKICLCNASSDAKTPVVLSGDLCG
jgi:hypothetical protein